LAPSYEVPHVTWTEKIVAVLLYVLPLAFIVFVVVGFIFLGIATPTEAAATGAASCFILSAVYKKLTWEMAKQSIASTVEITVMVFAILMGAIAFSQNLAYTGATKGLVELATGLPLPPIIIIITMQVAVLIMGALMEPSSIMMISLPIFMPVVSALGFDPVWFGTLILINTEMAVTSPPFGLTLFVMKGVAPPDTTIGDCYRAALPFLGCDLIVLTLILTFPTLALWLPGLMR
jgi:tripartite ATP-independent transporter DctM subunit